MHKIARSRGNQRQSWAESQCSKISRSCTLTLGVCCRSYPIPWRSLQQGRLPSDLEREQREQRVSVPSGGGPHAQLYSMLAHLKIRCDLVSRWLGWAFLRERIFWTVMKCYSHQFCRYINLNRYASSSTCIALDAASKQNFSAHAPPRWTIQKPRAKYLCVLEGALCLRF